MSPNVSIWSLSSIVISCDLGKYCFSSSFSQPTHEAHEQYITDVNKEQARKKSTHSRMKIILTPKAKKSLQLLSWTKSDNIWEHTRCYWKKKHALTALRVHDGVWRVKAVYVGVRRVYDGAGGLESGISEGYFL